MTSNKSIIITGGTGSFGKALLYRLLSQQDYARIIIFSRDEKKQADVFASAQAKFPNETYRLRLFVGDVRDLQRLKQAFTNVDDVVHAAALKRVDTGEYNPQEFVKTNINGTLNIIDAASAATVRRVVLLSSDKAVAPVNLYGKTKAVAESLMQQANALTHHTAFACVRYGNVWGSRGSVIETWQQQAELSLTDPLMTRFYFSLQESVDFVLRALERTKRGEIFVPRMHSVAMGNLAIALYPDKPMRIIGARPGEKYHETLVSQDELYRARWFDDCAVILPSSREWAADYTAYDLATPMRAPLTSEANPERLNDIDAIRAWVKDIQRREVETL